MLTYDPFTEALEIREQLSSEKRRLAFFFGAGTSMSAGLPGIDDLTKQVFDTLREPYKKQFENIRSELPKNPNVEIVLDRVRIYRELIGESKDVEYLGIKGAEAAKNLDSVICKAISDIISVIPPNGLKSHLIFSQWLHTLHCNRDYPVEIFTSNYDLLIEMAFEYYNVPFFDGFVGSVSPFFVPESVESEFNKNKIDKSNYSYPPRAWTRLWKLHGSINWHLQKKSPDSKEKITRLSQVKTNMGEELMIFPSREKYAQSRKLPFITFQDRLRNLVFSGENLVVILGYSFSDEHINEILFQSLKSNPRLAILVFMYESLTAEIIKYAQEHKKLTIYGPDKACIGGVVAAWREPRKKEGSENWPFWDEKSKQFTLGNFTSFTQFIEMSFGGRQTLIPTQINSNEKETVPDKDTKK